MSDQRNLKAGDIVKIDPRVYDYKWGNWSDLYKEYWYYELVIDRIVDLRDVGEGIFAIVKDKYGRNKGLTWFGSK